SDVTSLSNVRILDPNVLSPTFTQLQQLRNFYGFPETLSLDRYSVDGEMQDFLVAARELDPESLQANQRDWINRHTVYTHGNGFVAAPANRVNEIADDAGSDRGGLPNFQVSDLGAIASGEDMMIPVTEPRIYYGELIAQSDPDYAIVGENGDGPREYDTDTEQYTYSGEGGVPIGGWLNRSAYALKFTERNILLSGLIGDESKILYDRDPRDRVQKVAPWLTTDTTTYPAVIDGRIKWIVDGYTTLENYPYRSEERRGGTGSSARRRRAKRDWSSDVCSSALKFTERNLLLSGLIGDESKILYDRDPRDRVQKVAPWLTTDTTTYPAVIDGRIKWIVDGYTTLENYPYAERSSLEALTSDSTDELSGRVQADENVAYIRHSVKATVDAYD